MRNHNRSRLSGIFSIFLLVFGVSTLALADITVTGLVTPASVTTGTVTGSSVFVGDIDSTGSLSVDGGSSLLVDNVNGSTGILLRYNQGNLTISGVGTSVELNAIKALRTTGGGSVLIDGGSYVLLNGSDTRAGSGSINLGRAIVVSENSTVTVDGVGTQVDMIRRFGVGAFGTDGQMYITNGARVDMDGTDSSLFTSFIIAAQGGTGELTLNHGATFKSLVPKASIGISNSIAEVDILDSSLLELTTFAVIGGSGGLSTINITDSSFKVLADPAVPNPDTGNINLGQSGTGTINILRGLLEVENDLFVGPDASVDSSGRINMNDNSSALIGGNLYISHDGIVSAGLDPGYVLTCNSTLIATKTFIGENGELAGTTVNGDITVDGGTLSPGCSPGEMTVNGNTEFVGGRLIIEIDGETAVDQLIVLGDVTFGGGDIVLSFGNGFAPTAGTSLQVADYLTTQTISGIETVGVQVVGLQAPGGAEFEYVVDENGTVTTLTDAVPEFVQVRMDIRPGETNHVDPTSNQLFPVAILTTQDAPIFDATMVDPASLSFGPAGASPVAKKTRLKDVDGDGDLDLRVWFRIRATGISCTDVSADLLGQTFALTDFAANDGLVVDGCE